MKKNNNKKIQASKISEPSNGRFGKTNRLEHLTVFKTILSVVQFENWDNKIQLTEIHNMYHTKLSLY